MGNVEHTSIFMFLSLLLAILLLTRSRVLFSSVQVADKIRKDERVSVIERTNLRYLEELPQKVDIVTLDLSFISILTVS